MDENIKRKRKLKNNFSKKRIQLSDGQFYILVNYEFDYENVVDDDEGNFYGVNDIYAHKI